MKIGGTHTWNDRQRLLFLILILAAIGAFIAGVTNYFLYNAAFEQIRAGLVVTASSQARLIEAVARHEVAEVEEFAAPADGLALMERFHDKFEKFGASGEFVLARRVGDEIIFLFRRRHQDLAAPKPVPLDSDLAEPMRRALLGESGTMVGLDYRNREVLAAFEPVPFLKIGVVAKIDLSEIRAPFIKTGWITGLLALATIIAGAWLFVRTTSPMVRRIEEGDAKYRDLVETSQDLIWRIGEEGRFTYLNPAWKAALGYGPEEMLGRLFTDFKLPAEATRTLKEYKAVLGGGKVNDYETTYLSKSGQELTFIFKAKPIVDSSGKIVGTQGTAHDVTARKQAMEDLRRSRESETLALARLNDAIESLPVSFAIYDAEDRFVLCNSNTFKMFPNHAAFLEPGTSYEKVIRATLEMGLLQVRPDDPEGYIRERLREFREKPNLIEQHWADGRWFEVFHRPTSDGGTVTIRFDITSRKQAEHRLHQSEELFRLALGNSPISVFRQDRDLRFTWEFNPGPAFEPRSLLGKTDADVLPPDQAAGPMRLKREVLETGKPARDEFSFSAVGETFCYDVQITPDRNESGEVVGVICVFIDITERKQMEAKIQQVQKMEAVGTLAGGIAHNFNNLLQVIMGNTSQMLLEGNFNQSQHQFLQEIISRVKSGSELTKQLLGFAQGGQYDVKSQNLNPLLGRIANMFGQTQKDIEVHQKLGEALWNTKFDEGQIEQVLLNLFVNAQQSMPRGGQLSLRSENVTLAESIAKFQEVTPGEFVKVSVQDTGTGMDQATLGRIFEPFFSTKDVDKGTGLGLASAYGIIKNHGGFISVDSEVGKGTTFDIYLPATTDEIEEVQGTPKVQTPKGTGTILLVDDETDLVESGRRGLGMLGYHVITATSGKEALEVLGKNKGKTDLVILDMIMPGMGGGEAFDRLKELDPGVKVLLSSGYSLDGQATEIMERGCDGFIQKPFDLDALALQIHQILKGSKPPPGN